MTEDMGQKRNIHRLIRAHELMDEIIELADSGAQDLELLKIKIAARQWAAERLLSECDSRDEATFQKCISHTSPNPRIHLCSD